MLSGTNNNSANDIDEMIKNFSNNKPEFKSGDEMIFYKDQIQGKTAEQVSTLLGKEISTRNLAEMLSLETAKDQGGIIAVSGFYFQFLVTIEYIIELINGKWTNILVDHHQDIILISESKIRIIQVKTKDEVEVTPGQVDFYREWVQKLFLIEGLLKSSGVDLEKVKVEFELVTNFIIRDSKQIKTKLFLSNTDYDYDEELIETECRQLIEKIKKYPISDINYDLIKSEDYIKNMLRRFKVSSKTSESYFFKVASDFGDLYSERTKIVKKDIDQLIGFLCEKCTYRDNPKMQLIDADQAKQIMLSIGHNNEIETREHFETTDSIRKIKNYIKSLKLNFRRASIYSVLEEQIEKFEQELFQCIKSGESIFSILSRYSERVSISSKFEAYLEEDFTEFNLKEMLDLVFCLKILEDGEVSIDSSQKNLLLKKIGESNYNLFQLGELENHHKGEIYFQDIFNSLSFEDQFNLANNNYMKLVLAGDFDDHDFEYGRTHEIQLSKSPLKKEMENIFTKVDQDTFSKVSFYLEVINGSTFLVRDLHDSRMKRSKNWEELKKHLSDNLGCKL
ncbi:hypothetical protein [Exiguobacterium indicum]|uniref:hypothetical protein n=1 Tax=Exiguobacterium indicum TaxID=296995 RepID=UPI00094F62B5|nr:hypothetical protein [Exiguobacterium indicum]